MSIRPNSFLTRSTISATAALSVTSAVTDIALVPRCWSSATAALDFASLRPTTATAAPASARPRAMPSPMPPLPPVTIATLPVRSNGFDVMVRFPVLLSCADLIRASILLQKAMGCRVKPGNDEFTMRFHADLPLALPDQDQHERGQRRAVAGPLHLPDQEA